MISFRTRGLEAVQRFLQNVPRGTVKEALTAIAIYLIGNGVTACDIPIRTSMSAESRHTGKPFPVRNKNVM